MDMDRTGQFEEKSSAQKKFSPKQISFTYLKKKKTVFLTKKFLMLVWKNQFSKQKNVHMISLQSASFQMCFEYGSAILC